MSVYKYELYLIQFSKIYRCHPRNFLEEFVEVGRVFKSKCVDVSFIRKPEKRKIR